MKKMTKDEFVNKSKAIHTDRYDYSDSIYKNAHCKIIIVCREHGEFIQSPRHHLNGSGCPKCSRRKSLEQGVFIERSKSIHGDLYDYSFCEYKTALKKVDIICRKHGLFNQRPFDHLNGSGCPACGGTKKSNTEDFVKKATLVHGDKYDYSQSIYINDAKKLHIICKLHGIFNQRPNDHLQGTGCPKCGGTGKLNTQDFIERSIIVHSNKYNYGRVNYTTAHGKVLIECYDHGFFLQKAYVHMNGSGCPMCKESKGERLIQKALTDLGKKFYTQHKFDDCRNVLPLPFDFAVETKEGLVLIEYQGEQHYHPCGFGGNADINFQKIKKNDAIKRKFCAEKRYTLVEISYRDIEKIKSILSAL